MKKIILLFLPVLLFFSSPVFSQNVFEKGKLYADAGLSVGVFGYGTGARHAAGFPIPLTARLEYGIGEQFGIGPYVGYLHQGHDAAGFRTTFTTMAFGGQAVLHLTSMMNEHLELFIDEEKVDFYARAILGYERYGQRNDGQRIERQFLAESGSPVIGGVVGARYMVTPDVGAYAEFGRGIFGWLDFGVSFKF